MILYYATLITAVIAYLLSLIYYRLIFHLAFQQEVNKRFEPKNTSLGYRGMLWLLNFINIAVVVLLYATLGYTFQLFTLASPSTPYIISLIIWLIITSALILSAARVKQNQLITFLHSGYWFIVLLISAIILPILMG